MTIIKQTTKGRREAASLGTRGFLLPGLTGPEGDDAYELAVAAGFVGSRPQWVLSLKGEAGADGLNGQDAYEAAVEAGFVGTKAQWVASLKGAKGDTGDQGPPGTFEGEVQVEARMRKDANLSDVVDKAAGRSNLGLGDVNNTADTAKPVSTAQQTALNTKASLNGATFTNIVRTADTTGAINRSASSLAKLEVRAATGAGDAAFMQFHRPGYWAAYFGVDSDNQWKVGGWSMGAQAHVLWHAGNFNPASYAALGGNVSFNRVVVAENGTGTALQIGNDATMGDVDSENTVGLRGIQNPAVARLALGSAGARVSYDGGNFTFEGGTGVFWRSTVGGNATFWRVWDASNFNPASYAALGGATFSGPVYAHRTQGSIKNSTGGLSNLEVLGNGAAGDAAFMSFHRPGNYAAYFGLDSDNEWKVGGWSMGAVAHKLWHAGNLDPASVSGSVSPVASNLGSTTIPAGQKVIVMSGFWAEGDSGAGAVYVRGAGFAQRTDAGGNLWHIISTNDLDLGWLGLLPNRSDVGAMNHNVAWINTAIVHMGRDIGGGRLRFPSGAYYINGQLSCAYGGVLIEGMGGLEYPHDNPNAAIKYQGTMLVAAAAMTTMVYDYTPGYAERGVQPSQNWKNMGGGWANIFLNGNNSCNYCLIIRSRNTAKYHLRMEHANGEACVLMDCQSDFRGGGDYQIGEPGDNQCLDLEFHIRQSDYAGPNTHAVVMRGLANNGNTSIIDKVHITAYVFNGHGVLFENSDNVVIAALRVYCNGPNSRPFYSVAPTAGSFDYGNIIHRLSCSTRPGLVEGQGSRPGAVAPGQIIIGTLDTGNLTPIPEVQGNGQCWVKHGHEGEQYWNNGLGAWTLKQKPANGNFQDGGMALFSAAGGQQIIFLQNGQMYFSRNGQTIG